VALVALLDVNVLVALFDAGHVHHDVAHDWFADHRAHGWATCPLTELGLLRLMANPHFLPNPLRLSQAVDNLRTFCASGHHHFWSDTISIRDEGSFAADMTRGHQQLTDVYLLGLAARRGGTLVTFDRGVSLSAVKGATSEHLTVVAPA